MITILGYHFWSDWTDEKKIEVDETKIYGFEIHYRGDNSWHVVVKVHKDYHYGLDFEIEHEVCIHEIIKLLLNPKAKILKIVNYHVYDSFIGELKELFRKLMRSEEES